jgi:uroporphyrinogen-III synthase
VRGSVVLTASAGSFPGLVEILRELPVAVEERPLMRFGPPEDWTPVDAALAADRYRVVAITSPRAAEAIVGRIRGREPGITLRHAEVWAVGAATARVLREVAPEVRLPGEHEVGRRGAAAALAQAMLQAGVVGPVLFPCGDRRRDELPARLRDDGIAVDEVVCYRSVLASEGEAREAAERAWVLVVASPSVADLLARACPPGVRPALLAVGPTTAAASRAAGWAPAATAKRPTADALAGAIRGLLP